MRETSKTTPDRLGRYLAAAVGVGALTATADAAIIQLDVSAVSGVNAGLAPGEWKTVSLGSLGPDLEGDLTLHHQFKAKYPTDPTLTGLSATGGAMIAAGTSATSPTNFATGTLIGADTPFSTDKYNTLFVNGSNVSPEFAADSFMGFKSAGGHFGWLEVTWDSTAGNFEILSGAYQKSAGVAILAGAAVPEPGGALGILVLLTGGTFFSRRKLAA